VSVLLAGAVRLVTRLAALVLVMHVVFQVFHANRGNGLVRFTGTLADQLALGLRDLFLLTDPRWETLVNYGLAALVWLIGGAVVAGLVRRGH
jgi:hypothetical protein